MAVEYRREGRIGIIVINRPEKQNALDIPALEEMGKALVALDADPALRAGIITGSGDEAFCAGIDIGSAFSPGQQPRGPFPATLMRGLEIAKPLIAAVNGAALGGGLELVLACDLRLAVTEATFASPEVTLGLIPGWGGTQKLPRQVPWCLAAQLLLTGQAISAAEAFHIGLINRVVARQNLMATALEWAEVICRAAPLAVQAAKEAMLKGAKLPMDEGLELEDALVAYLKTTRDFSEGIRAFKEKRRPDFQGL